MMKLAFSMGALPLLLGSALAHAATPPDNQVTEAKDLEVIEVYAQKRRQPLSDVSASVSVVSGETLRSRHIKDSTELAFSAPNLKISQNAAEGTPPAFNIRGVGLTDYNTANTSPVAVYVDELAVGSANNQIVNLFDVERVEVLRGPQGTLFGRNTTGGAILIRSQRPENSQEAYLRVGMANHDSRSLDAMYNQPLGDETALRLAFNHQKYDYTTRNLYPAAPEAGMEQNNARLMLASAFGPLDVLFKTHLESWQGWAQPVGNIGIFANPLTGELCSPEQAGSTNCFDAFGFNSGSDDFFAVMVNNDSPHESDGRGASLHLDWQLSDWTLRSLTGYNRLERSHAFNCDGSPANLCEGALGLDTRLWTQEFILSGAAGKGFLTSGLFYLDEKIAQDNYNDILRDLRGILPTNLTATFFYDNLINSRTVAVYGQLDYPLAENWLLTAGLRYSDEEFDYDSRAELNAIVNPADLAGMWIPFYHVAGDQQDSGVSGKLALNWQLGRDDNLYYSFANGDKSGGYNGGFLSSPEQAGQAAYGPESLNAHELGARFYWPRQGLRWHSALFYYDYHDQQVFMNQPSSVAGLPPFQLLENVADLTIYGFESELEFAPLSALQGRLSLGYIPHAVYEDYVDPVGVELSGHRLPFTSRLNLSGELSYAYVLGQGSLRASAQFDYQSEYYFDQNENPYARQGGYTRWDAQLRYQAERWALALWAKNLFDKEYSHLKFDLSSFLGMLEDFKGDGRRFGIELSYYF